MEGLNQATVFGNLAADPEIHVVEGGQPVLNMRIATDLSYLDRAGKRAKRTDWHAVAVWGRRAEALSRILRKGDVVLVQGRLQTRAWQVPGERGKRYATEIVADTVVLGGKRPERAPAPPPTARGDAPYEPAEEGDGNPF